MVTLLDAGLPLVRSVGIVASQSLHPQLKVTMEAVRQDLNQGTRFSESLAKHSQVFPRLYIHMVRVGENTGDLSGTMRKLADTLNRQAENKGKLLSTLTYPAIVMIASLGALYVMLTFTIPMMSGLFTEFKTGMPFLTRVVIAMSNGVKNYGSLFLIAMVATAVLGYVYTRTPRGALQRDRLLMRLPGIGNVVQKSQVAALMETIARALETGTPLLEAMQLAEDISDNHAVRLIIQDVIRHLMIGHSLSEALASHPELFPSMVVETVKVAEETGRLQQQITVVAQLYQEETERAIKAFIGLLEPAIILIVGLIVAFIATTVLSTVYGVLPAIKPQTG
jgi:type II secretory pathway component PulF